MKMTIYKKLWAFALIIPMVIACEESEGPTSVIQSFAPITLDASAVTAINVTEGSIDAASTSVSFPIGASQIVPVTVNVAPGATSTADPVLDYRLTSTSVTVPTLGEAVIGFTTLFDWSVEGPETIYFDLSGDASDVIGLDGSAEVLAVTIQDSVATNAGAPAIGIALDWEGEIQAFPGNYWCGFMDIDLFILDGGGTEVTGFAAATGACPEVLFTTQIPDGTFTIEANLWSNPITGNGLSNEILPLSATIFQSGTASHTLVPNDAGATPVWNGDTPSDQAGANNITIGTLTKAGNVLTIADHNGNVIGTVGS